MQSKIFEAGPQTVKFAGPLQGSRDREWGEVNESAAFLLSLFMTNTGGVLLLSVLAPLVSELVKQLSGG